MLYDSYHKKISKIVGFLRKFFKHIVLISIITGLVLAAVIAFMITKGIVIDDKSIEDNFEWIYGDDIPLKSKALFAKVSYEYSEDGEEWSDKLPTSLGEHKVRAKAKSIFGKYRYGQIYTFSVEAKEIEVSVSDKKIMYGNLPAVTASALVYDDALTCDKVIYDDRLASITNVKPDVDSIKILNADDVDVTALYKLKVKKTAITITPRPITVIVSGKEMIYNDTKLLYDGYMISEKTPLADGDDLQAFFDESKYIIDVGELKYTPELRVVSLDDTELLDVSAHYSITTEIGTLKVDHRPLIVQVEGAEKVYDDKELSNSKYTISGDYGLVEGHISECVSHTSIIDVSEVENILMLKIKNAQGEDKTSNYSLFYEKATLKITPRTVNISTKSETWVYDSYEHYTEEVISSGLCEGHKAVPDGASIVDVGTVENALTIKSVYNAQGRDVVANYEFVYGEVGTLTVTKRPISITHEGAAFEYDGVERKFDDYQITSGSFAENDVIAPEFKAFSQAGTYKNKFDSLLVTSTRMYKGETMPRIVAFNAVDNYEIFEDGGDIVIDKYQLSIQAPNINKIYNAQGVEDVGNPTLSRSLPSGHQLNVVYKPVSADVGTYVVEIDLTQTKILYNGNDAIANFDIATDIGELVISKRPITIVAGSSDKPYDGTPLTSTSYEITEGELVQGHNISFTFIGSQTVVGSCSNVIDQESIIISDVNNANVTKNYDITCVDGTLTVVKRKIAVTSNSDSKLYDGTPLRGKEVTVDAVSYINNGLPTGHKLVYTLPNSITEVGTIPNEIEGLDIVDSNGVSVKQYYEITSITIGTLEVKNRVINIATGSDQKVYDGTPLTCNEVTTNYQEIVASNHTATLVVTGTITNVGSETNSVKFTIFDQNGRDITNNGNYIINYDLGTLTVTPRIINITTGSDEKVYDGTPLTSAECTSNYQEMVLTNINHSATLEITGTITNVGSVKNSVKFTILDQNGRDITNDGNYKINYDLGTLTVTPRIINIATGSAEKVYDGTPLTSAECTSNYQEMVLTNINHSATLEITGTITNAGSVTNSVKFTIRDQSGRDITNDGNYKINYDLGTLTVSARIIRVIPLPERTTKLYDGIPLECTDYSLSNNMAENEGLLENHVLKNLYFTPLVDAGKIPIDVDEDRPFVIMDGNTNVSSNYTIVVEGGATFEIFKRNIVIKTDSARKVYDGRPLTAPGCAWVSSSEHTLVSGHKLAMEASGSQTEVGISDNYVDNPKIVDGSGNDVTHNYNITYEIGTLEVYKVKVATVISSKGGYVYLKVKSYGNYNGQGFESAPSCSYSFRYSGYSRSYMLWSSATLTNYNINTLKVTLEDGSPYMLPYYMAINDSYGYDMPSYRSEDYSNLSSDKEYTVPYYDYSYEEMGSSNFERCNPSNASSYTSWVKSNYLTISNSTKTALLNLVSSEGFDNMSTEEKIKAVAKYVRSTGSYNTNYDVSLDSESDIAVAFLQGGKEGVCRHYAIAATMLYRALDIPARYVEGYVVETVANEPTDVTDAHAWVEVFVDGYGWMMIEVTTGSADSEDEKIDIIVKPKDESKVYDGTPLTPSGELNILADGVDLTGYRFVATCTGSQTNVGTSDSSIETLEIYDAKGNRVTKKFNVTLEKGKLTVTPISIEIYLDSIRKPYDGTVLDYGYSDFYVINDEKFLATNYSLSISTKFTNANVHALTIKDLNENIGDYFDFAVMNGAYNLTSNYTLKIVPYSSAASKENTVVVEIFKKEIDVITATETMVYSENAVLENHTVTVIDPLISGYTLEVTVTGKLDMLGSTPNTIDETTLVIKDADGNVVTDNYDINVILGTLTFVEKA